MYGKYYAQTFTGSMAGIGAVRHAVWGYCIANARADGTLELNPITVAAAIGCKTAEVEEALEFHCAPDPKSRTKTNEGRKLEQIADFEYRLTNYTTFRGITKEVDRREYNRLKKRESREREKQRREAADRQMNGEHVAGATAALGAQIAEERNGAH